MQFVAPNVAGTGVQKGDFVVKKVFGIILAATVVTGVVYANQSPPNTLVVPVSKAPANDGKQMYVNFCAPCHGLNGKGQGPVAAALKRQPANLTLLSKNNGGKFPEAHIVSVLQFGAANPAHGTAPMPIWGPTFQKMDATTNLPPSDVRTLRISNLSNYLRSLQEK